MVFFTLTYQNRPHQIVEIRVAETYCHWWRGPNYSAVFKHFKKNTNSITDVKVLYLMPIVHIANSKGESIFYSFLSVLMTTIKDFCQKHMLTRKFILPVYTWKKKSAQFLNSLEIKAFGFLSICYKTIFPRNIFLH